MGFEYVEPEAAMSRSGLRMVVVGGVPSPWGEAAKGVFHIKRLDWTAVRLVYDDPALAAWAGGQSAPAAVYEGEAPRTGWAEILLLAERLAPEPALVPEDPNERAMMFGLAHELLGEGGLAWSRRLQLVAAGLNGQGGFPERVAHYIGGKYGYTPAAGAASGPRVAALLAFFSGRLAVQAEAGGRFLMAGERPTAADIYCATTMALFAPPPEARCAMNPATRAAFETLDPATEAALDPALLAHRDMMYEAYLEPVFSL